MPRTLPVPRAHGTWFFSRILAATEEVPRRYGPAKAAVVDVARAPGVVKRPPHTGEGPRFRRTEPGAFPYEIDRAAGQQPMRRLAR